MTQHALPVIDTRPRARTLDRTIDAAAELGPLYRERDRLTRLIGDEESGRAERKRQAKADRGARVRAAKQATNETREYPDWRTFDPDAAIEHTRTEGEGPTVHTLHTLHTTEAR